MASTDPSAEKQEPKVEQQQPASNVDMPNGMSLTVEELYDKDKFDLSTMEPGDVFQLLQYVSLRFFYFVRHICNMHIAYDPSPIFYFLCSPLDPKILPPLSTIPFSAIHNVFLVFPSNQKFLHLPLF